MKRFEPGKRTALLCAVVLTAWVFTADATTDDGTPPPRAADGGGGGSAGGDPRGGVTVVGKKQDPDPPPEPRNPTPPWRAPSIGAGGESGGGNPGKSPPHLGAGGEPGSGNPGKSQKDNPASDQNTAPSCASNPKTGQPVVIATGEKYKDEPDFAAGSAYGLGLTRTYRSYTTRASMFGPKWLSTYDYPKLIRTGCFNDPDFPGVCARCAGFLTEMQWKPA